MPGPGESAFDSAGGDGLALNPNTAIGGGPSATPIAVARLSGPCPVSIRYRDCVPQSLGTASEAAPEPPRIAAFGLNPNTSITGFGIRIRRAFGRGECWCAQNRCTVKQGRTSGCGVDGVHSRNGSFCRHRVRQSTLWNSFCRPLCGGTRATAGSQSGTGSLVATGRHRNHPCRIDERIRSCWSNADPFLEGLTPRFYCH
jgi:hypothetical protein